VFVDQFDGQVVMATEIEIGVRNTGEIVAKVPHAGITEAADDAPDLVGYVVVVDAPVVVTLWGRRLAAGTSTTLGSEHRVEGVWREPVPLEVLGPIDRPA
jgi:hypothetical protein